jgi:hypothetical protein
MPGDEFSQCGWSKEWCISRKDDDIIVVLHARERAQRNGSGIARSPLHYLLHEFDPQAFGG